jgi:hypothetical protein
MELTARMFPPASEDARTSSGSASQASASRRRVPQCAKGQQTQPERERPRRKGDHDEPRFVPGSIGSGRGDACQHQRQQEKERAERPSLARRSQGDQGCRNHPGTIARQPEGRSSTGRAPVSKTGGCRFESCRPCRESPALAGLSLIGRRRPRGRVSRSYPEMRP